VNEPMEKIEASSANGISKLSPMQCFGLRVYNEIEEIYIYIYIIHVYIYI